MKILILGGGLIKTIQDSSFIKNNNCNLVLWSNPLSLTANKSDHQFENINNQLLSLEFNKTFIELLQRDKYDSIIIESGTFAFNLIKYSSTIFTRSNQVTSIYNIGEIINVLDADFSSLCSYIEAFIETLTKYFVDKSIIILSSKQSEYYVESDTLKYEKSSNYQLKFNSFLNKIENALLNKINNVHLIDINKNIFTLKISSPIYQKLLTETYDEIFHKINNEKRLSNIPFIYKLKVCSTYSPNPTTIKYFENILSESYFDNVLLYSSKSFISSYLKEIKELENKNIKTYDDLKKELTNYENNDLKKMIISIYDIIERKELSHVDMIVKYRSRILTKAAKILTDKLKEFTINISYKDINFINIEEISTLTNELLNNSEADKAKCITEIKRVLPIHIDIWGSCYSRLIQNYCPNELVVDKYLYQVNPLMIDDQPSKYPESTFLEVPSWDEKMVKIQLDNSIRDFFKDKKAEWLLIDFYTLVGDRQFFYEDGKEIYAHPCEAFSKLDKSFKRFSHYQLNDIENVKNRLDNLIKYLTKTYGKRVIVISSKFTKYYIDANNKVCEFTGVKTLNNLEANHAFYETAINYFVEQSGFYYIDITDYYMADVKSIMALAPQHYEKGLYLEECKIIKSIIQNHESKQHKLIFNEISKQTIIERMMRLNKDNKDNPLYLDTYKDPFDKFLATQDENYLKEYCDILINK